MSIPKKVFSLAAALLLVFQQFAYAVETINSAEVVPLSAAAVVKLEKFNKKTNSSWQIRMNSKTGAPRALVNGQKMRVGRSESAALSFLKSNKDFLGVDISQLKLKVQRKSPIGSHYYFDQYYKNLKVENAYVKVNANNKGELINYQSTFVDNLDMDIKPVKDAAQAASKAASDAGGTVAGSPELVIYSSAEGAKADLAWKVKIQQGEQGKWNYFINAADGEILNKVSLFMHAAETFNAKLNPVYPGFGSPVNLDNTTVNLSNLNVQYYNAAAALTTSAAGVATLPDNRTGRVYYAFSGPYFTVSDQRSNNGYYIEYGKKADNSLEPFSPVWETVANNVSPNPASVSVFNPDPPANCQTPGTSPLIAAPLFTNFSVGNMLLPSGGIPAGQKAFLNIIAGSKTLSKYIGIISSSFAGPFVPFLTGGQTLNFSITPAGKTGTYNVSNLQWLCVPANFATDYNPVTTHTASQLSYDSANTFYNLNAMRDFFQALNLGNYINLSNHLPVIINAYGRSYSQGQNGMLNAFYDVDEKVIMYGQGEKMSGSTNYKSFAKESAIVRHEYVHAVMDNIWPIMYFDEGAAIAEGVSDYFALSSIVNPVTGYPYTSEIGTFVALQSATGEGMVRNLNGNAEFDPLDWISNGASGQYHNSLILSQALWEVRNNAITKDVADGIVFTALMFFPDSFLEFRDAMLAASTALGYTTANSVIEAAFDRHKINYDSIITANGDIYEPNNGPDNAANIDIASIAKKELSASINPVSDMDYYSVSLPAGEFTVTAYMQQADTANPVTYYPVSMILLDANLKTVVDVVRPAMTTGQSDQTTIDKSVTLKYNVPALLNGNTGRYILGVFKPEDAAYPPAPLTVNSGAYKLVFKFAKGSNVGDVTTVMPDFTDGKQISFSVPFTTYGNVTPGSTIPAGLTDWTPNIVEAFHSVKLLDQNLTPLDDNYLSLVGDVTYDANEKQIKGTVEFANSFSALGYNTVYLQVFGKVRSSVSGTNPEYYDEYGIVSLGISNPIRNQTSSGRDVYIERSIFNPDRGEGIKIEVNPKQDGKLKVQVFTLDGLPVKMIFDGDVVTALPEYIEWDGKNTNGNTVASGLYLLRIDGAGISKQLKKIVVVK